jgi:L,D-transpeptidase ErfK/SrfK
MKSINYKAYTVALLSASTVWDRARQWAWKPLSIAIAVLVTLPAQAEPIRAPLLPGRLVGGVNQISRPADISIDLLASYYGVHSNRISKLDSGELRLDQRRIEPKFYDWVNGIVLNVPEAHLYLVRDGQIVKSYPVGVSRSSWQVPLGRTQVVRMDKNPTWYVPESIQQEMARKGQVVREQVPPGPNNPLGSRWIGFATGSYGFHGTSDPASIKDYESHGCVRMLEPHVQELFEQVKVGTPVRIYYQPVKLAVEGDRIWMASYPDIYNLYNRGRDPHAMVRELATQAGVLDRIDWQAVERKLREQDGIISNVALSRS